MDYVFIYPNQLFENHPALSKNKKVLLIEEPLFFGDIKYSVKFHKKKILLHHLSIKSYVDFLKSAGYDVEIVRYKDLKRESHTKWIFYKYKIKTLHLVDVIDYELENRIKSAAKERGVSISWHDNPNFLLNNSDVLLDFSGKKRHFMANFYKKQRKRFDILIDDDGNPDGGKWSYDAENRKKLPKNISLPSDLNLEYNKSDYDLSKKFIDKNFADNYGDINGFNYPINHNQAKKSLDFFLEKKFELFGPYEDAISSSESKLFHSILTPYLNIGLITPNEIINRVSDYAKEYSIPINSYEGFIRQIIGWREFIRGIYVVDGVKQRTTNFWRFDKSIPKSFYNGNTGIKPVDKSIVKLINDAYLHHIERLMVMGNIFFLLKINPDAVYKWFMELFIDAYDWVMVPNVYGMSQFSDGGLMSTKPYISGSNYILKMSDYKKDDWCQTWDALYWNFINQNRNFFRKNPRTSMMINMYDKKSKEMKSSYIELERNLRL